MYVFMSLYFPPSVIFFPLSWFCSLSGLIGPFVTLWMFFLLSRCFLRERFPPTQAAWPINFQSSADSLDSKSHCLVILSASEMQELAGKMTQSHAQ